MFLIIAAFSTLSYGQQPQQYFSGYQESIEKDTAELKNYSLAAFPFVFFLPETSFGFGGLGSYTFRFKDEPKESVSSQVQVGIAYTLRNQFLFFLPFQLRWKNDNYRTEGELGYYRYIYDFFGLGNDADGDEIYSANFSRVRINAVKKVSNNIYGGVRYWFDDYKIVERDPNGLLENEQITGSQGGYMSGAGLIFIYDSRDQPFASEKGLYTEYVMFRSGERFGSDFEFSKIYLDVRYFYKNKWDHVLAFNSYTELTGGDAPFNQLSLLGGPKRLRGYIEGRFRENHMQVIQAEYRAHLFWRLGIVAFGGVGAVENRIVDFDADDIRYTVGAGLRFRLTKEEKVNLRIDAGVGKDTFGFYVTIGEAF